MIKYLQQQIGNNLPKTNSRELFFSLMVGLLFGALVVFSPYLPFPSNFQKLFLIIPFAFMVVILFNNLERLILFTLAIGVPLNLDISLIISPYARNIENMANGRTIVALTELRVSLMLVVVIIGYMLWLIDRQSAHQTPVNLYPAASIPALGLILISIVSITQAQDTQLSIFKIVQLIELFLIYFYVANHIRTVTDLNFFLTVLMSAMLVENTLIIVQKYTGLSFIVAGINASYSSISGRPGGTLGPAGNAGGINASLLIISLALIWLSRTQKQRLFNILFFLIGCIALIISGSRAAWGSFIIAMIGFMVIGWKLGRINWKSLLSIFILTLIVVGIFYKPIYSRLTLDDRGSAASRPKMFRLAWNVITASPTHFFFGVGANNYALIAPLYNTADVGDLGYIIDSSVHNTYLLTWSELGLLGALFFIGFLTLPLTKLRTHLISDNQYISIFALALGCSLIATYIQMSVDPFIARPKMTFWWFLVSLAVCLSNLVDHPSSSPSLKK